MIPPFKRVRLQDRGWVTDLLSKSQFMGCEYSFGSLFLWQDAYRFKIARYKDFLLVRSENEESGYGYPAGQGDVKELFNLLMNEAKQNKTPLRILGVTGRQVKELYQLYGRSMDAQLVPESYDYIYNQADLAQLPGRKFHQKRNHISHFLRQFPDWSYEEITPRNTQDCYRVTQIWCEQNNCIASDGDVCVLQTALAHYQALRFSGGLIRINGQAAAFCMGEQLNDNTFVIHFEKALNEYNGLYAMINREFTMRALSEYQYINREEDLGLPGLRKAKLSYHPVMVLQKANINIGV